MLYESQNVCICFICIEECLVTIRHVTQEHKRSAVHARESDAARLEKLQDSSWASHARRC